MTTTCRHYISPRCILALTLLLGLLFSPFLIGSAHATSRIWCVDARGGMTSPPCANPSAYPSIQAAVNAAAEYDEIYIAGGTYTAANGYVVYTEKSLTLRGGYQNGWQSPTLGAVTVIDGQQRTGGIGIFGASVTLERFSITHGARGGIEANMNALQTLVLIDSIVTHNTTPGSGGGILSVGGMTELYRTTVTNNTAMEDGGGFYGFDLRLNQSIVANNVAARHAGGVSGYRLLIDQSEIVANHATSGDGGGIYVDETVIVRGSQILENRAGQTGGGVYARQPRVAQFQFSVIGNNRATTAVDGVYIADRIDEPTEIQFLNTTLASDEHTAHSAVSIWAQPESFEMTNTIVANHAIGIELTGTTPLSGNYNAFVQNTVDLQVGDKQPPLPFVHVIRDDPRFVHPPSSNFHLASTSPLIDAGDPNGGDTSQRDIDGQPVPLGAGVDIGADETFQVTSLVYAPMVQQY